VEVRGENVVLVTAMADKSMIWAEWKHAVPAEARGRINLVIYKISKCEELF
jgi:hypothetical protein